MINVGDRVRCINSIGSPLVIGKIYTVTFIITDIGKRISLDGVPHRYSVERFVEVDEDVVDAEIEEEDEIDAEIPIPAKPTTYRIGQLFKIRNWWNGEDEIYLLSSVGGRKCCLINVTTGNRYNNPLDIWKVMKISEAELSAMSSGKAELLDTKIEIRKT